MFNVVLVAAITAGSSAADHHGMPYGACYGACYGVGYNGWPGWGAGGWGKPAGWNWHGYAGWGGCGGYCSPAFGHPMAPVITGGPRTYSGSELPKPDERERKKEDQDDKIEKDDKIKHDNASVVKQSNRARLIVNLPREGKLFVDDRPVADATRPQGFTTPELDRNKRYFYELRAEVVRDGRTVTETRRVVLRAGEVIRADLTNLGSSTGVATSRSR
jgi:uncharacterized protein (TIGR03000 family)